MLKIHKYFRFYPDPESYCTTLDGRRLLGIRPGLETLPPNKSPNKVASNFGPAGIPEWLESLKLAVIRDGDDAKASLKDFDYRFNSRTASSDVDQLVQPSTDNNPGVERQKRGERDKDLVKAALNRSVERIARDGAAARKKIAGVEKKVELTRKIQETVRRDANAASPGIKDHEFAKAWYVRPRTINSMYSRGKRIFHIGREWEKKTYYLTDAQI